MDLASIGLIIIAIGWLIQLAISWKGNDRIHPAFILCYMLGVMFLLVSGYLGNASVSPYEVITFLAALIVLLKISLPKKRK